MLILKSPHQKTQALCLLFHGYGATAANLKPIAVFLQKAVPNITFVLPEAPRLKDGVPGWFSLHGLETRYETKLCEKTLCHSLAKAATQWVADHAVFLQTHAHRPLFLAGFSQGAMMALECARHHLKTDAVFSYAGGLHNAGMIPGITLLAPQNALFCHGKIDPVVPCQFSETAHHHYQKQGIPSTLMTTNGVEHWIDPSWLEKTAKIMKTVLEGPDKSSE